MCVVCINRWDNNKTQMTSLSSYTVYSGGSRMCKERLGPVCLRAVRAGVRTRGESVSSVKAQDTWAVPSSKK